MKILTETMLRAQTLAETTIEYRVASDVFVTPLAKEYLRDRGISLVVVEVQPTEMTRTPLKMQGQNTYIDDVTGEGYAEKPEHMTHLRENILVSKTHPRIHFRGCMDGLQAEIIWLQTEAYEMGYEKLLEDLKDILYSTRLVLGAEVKDETLGPVSILGLGEKDLREKSHNVKKYFGIEHPVPEYSMGRMAASLNRLRTKVREAELLAADAFIRSDGTIERPDIIQHLNRMSSAVYIVFCQWLTGYYKGGRRP